MSRRPSIIEGRVFHSRTVSDGAVRMVLKREGNTVVWCDDGTPWPGEKPWSNPKDTPVPLSCGLDAFAKAVFLHQYIDDLPRCKSALERWGTHYLEEYKKLTVRLSVAPSGPCPTLEDTINIGLQILIQGRL